LSRGSLGVRSVRDGVVDWCSHNTSIPMC
jgi:hypothetical protein